LSTLSITLQDIEYIQSDLHTENASENAVTDIKPKEHIHQFCSNISTSYESLTSGHSKADPITH